MLHTALATRYLDSWRAAASPSSIDPAGARICLCNERLLLWEYFSRPEVAAGWTRRTTFLTFFERYAKPLLDNLAFAS